MTPQAEARTAAVALAVIAAGFIAGTILTDGWHVLAGFAAGVFLGSPTPWRHK